MRSGSPSAAESQASYRPHKLVVALWMDEPLLGKRFWLVVVSSYPHTPRTKKIDVAVLNATGDAEFQEC